MAEAPPPPLPTSPPPSPGAAHTVLRATARLYQRITANIILVLGFFGLLYFLLYFTINSNYARRAFNELVNGKAFRGSITWERLSWGPWPSELRILRPVLAEPGGRPVIRVAEVDVSLDLLALRDGAVVASDIIIDTPHCTFRNIPATDVWGNTHPTLNIGAMFGPPQPSLDDGQPGGPPTLSFRVAEIRNARYQMDLPQVEIDARGVWVQDAFFELRANPNGVGPVLMDMAARSVQIRAVDLAVPRTPSELPVSRRPAAETLQWKPRGLAVRNYRWHDWGFQVENLRGRLGEDRLTVRGFSLGLDPVRGVSVGAQIGLQLADVAPHLRMVGIEDISGAAELTLQTSGELMSQAGSGSLSGPSLGLPGGVQTGSWTLDLRHAANRIDVDRLAVDIADGHMEGEASLDGERNTATASVRLAGVVPGTLPPTSELGSPWADLLQATVSGSVSGHVKGLFGVAEQREFAVEADLDAARPADVPSPLPAMTRVQGSAIWRGTHVNLRHLILRTPGNEVHASGDLDLEARTTRGHLALRSDELAPWTALAHLPLRGGLVIAADWSGPFARPDLTAEIRGDGVAWAGFPEFGLDLGARMERGRLQVTHLKAESGTTTLEAQGRAELRPHLGALSATARLTGADVPAWLPGVPVTGRLDAHVRAEGRVDAPLVTADVQVAGAGYGDWPKAELSARLHSRGLRRPEVTAERMDVKTEHGTAHVEGRVAFAPALPDSLLSFQVELAGVELGSLPLPLPQASPPGHLTEAQEPPGRSLSGRVDAQVTVAGRAGSPGLEGHVVVGEPRYGPVTLARLETDASLHGGELRLAGLKLAEAGEPRPHVILDIARLTLRLADLAFDGELTVDALPLSLVAALAADPEDAAAGPAILPDPATGPAPIPGALPLGGNISITLAGHGTPSNPVLEGELSLNEVAWGEVPLGNARLRVEAGGRRVRIDGEALDGVQLAASLPTTPGQGPATFTLRFADLSPEARLASIPAVQDLRLQSRLSGTLSGGVDLFETPPWEPFADLEITDLRATMGQLDLVALEPIRARYRDGDLSVTRLSVRAAGQNIRAEGALRHDGGMSAQVDGDLDLSLLAGLLSSTFSAVQGQASVSLRLAGTLDEPQAQGRIRLTRASLSPRSPIVGTEVELMEPVELWVQSAMGPALNPDEDLRGNLVITLPRLVPEGPGGPPRTNRLVIRRDDGQLWIDALDVELKRFLPASLAVRLDADNVSLTIPDLVRGTFSADDLRFSISDLLRPSSSQLFLGGGVYVQRAVYTADILSSTEINQGVKNNLAGVSQARTISAFERYPILQRFKVNLRVDGENDIFIRNSVAVVALNLEIRPSVRVRGNLYPRTDLAEGEKLVIEGEVFTLPDTSKIIYATREFDVTSGQVDFGKGSFLDATLVAQRDFPGCAAAAAGSSAAGDPTLRDSAKQERITLDLRLKLPDLGARPEVTIDLSSDSGLSKIDAAALVLTGACAAQLTAASGAQPALQTVMGPIIGLVDAQLEQTLDINLNLTPESDGTLFVEAEKQMSKRLRLYSYAPIGENAASLKRTIGLEYQINNFFYGDLSNESLELQNSTTGRLKLRLNLD